MKAISIQDLKRINAKYQIPKDIRADKDIEAAALDTVSWAAWIDPNESVSRGVVDAAPGTAGGESMSAGIIRFIIGLVAGGLFGVLATAVIVAGRDDEGGSHGR